MSTAIARSPLHHWHEKHGARFTDSGGWQIPSVFTDIAKETEAARTGAALADISHCAKVSLSGAGVAALAESLGGAAQIRGLQAEPDGNAHIACRLTAKELLVLGTAPQLEFSSKESKLQAAVGRMEFSTRHKKITAINVTSNYAGFCLVGPKIETVLRGLTSFDVSEPALPIHSCAETSLAEIHCTLVRTEEFSQPSVRVYIAWDAAEWVWSRLLESGRCEHIVPLGMETLARLKLAKK